MTFTLRDAIAELDAAADIHIQRSTESAKEFVAKVRNIARRAKEAGFTDAEGLALIIHTDDAVSKRVEKAIKEAME